MRLVSCFSVTQRIVYYVTFLIPATISSCYDVIKIPLPSNRHLWSNGNCLEDKRENYEVCRMYYCVQQLCTLQCTHIWTDTTFLWIAFCLTGPISLCLDSFLCMYVCILCYYHILYVLVIVTWWWGGSGGIEAWSLGPLLPSVLWHCWLGHLIHKTRPWYGL